jgi:uncharacterized OB-fold protein
MSYDKPVPVVDPESRPFWEACRRHELSIPQCLSCGQTRFPPTTFCPHCQSSDTKWLAASGRGTVFSWIVVRHPVPKEVYAPDVPYVVAIVQLAEGVRMVANLEQCDPDAVSADMPVSIGFRDVTAELTLPVFHPSPS